MLLFSELLNINLIPTNYRQLRASLYSTKARAQRTPKVQSTHSAPYAS